MVTRPCQLPVAPPLVFEWQNTQSVSRTWKNVRRFVPFCGLACCPRRDSLLVCLSGVSDIEADRKRLVDRLSDAEAHLAIQSRENENLLLKLERARAVRVGPFVVRLPLSSVVGSSRVRLVAVIGRAVSAKAGVAVNCPRVEGGFHREAGAISAQLACSLVRPVRPETRVLQGTES